MNPGSNSLAGGSGRSVTAVTASEPETRPTPDGAAQPASTSTVTTALATTAAAFAMLIEATIPVVIGWRLGIASDPLARCDPVGELGECAVRRRLVVAVCELLP